MPATDQEIQAARQNFLEWLKWHQDRHRDELPTQQALADALGVTSSAVSQWMTPGSSRLPSFEVLISAQKLIGMPLDYMLTRRPPSGASGAKGKPG